jgi:site-specific DNA-methyltransferase (adenine-specific)
VRPYYEDALTTIYHGDCLEVMSALASESVGAVITDPPYSSGTRQSTNRTAGAIPKRGERWSRGGILWDSSFSTFGISMLLNHAFRETKRLLVDGGHLYSFIDWRHYPMLTLTMEASGLFINNLLVWDKGVYALGGNYRSQHELIVFASRGPAEELTGHDIGNVIQSQRVSGGDHPTEKPLDLLGKILKYASPGLVLDPFLGSGTTLVAAKSLGRKSIGVDVEERYCEMAAKRLAQETLGLAS